MGHAPCTRPSRATVTVGGEVGDNQNLASHAERAPSCKAARDNPAAVILICRGGEMEELDVIAVQGWVVMTHPDQVGHSGGGLAVSVVSVPAHVHWVRHLQLPVLAVSVVDVNEIPPASSIGIVAVDCYLGHRAGDDQSRDAACR